MVICGLLAKLTALLLGLATFGYAQDFDVLIHGGRIVDGTGNPSYLGDLGIRQGKIAAIGHLAGKTAAQTIDVTGLTVAPGFIDIHNHSDYTILEDPDAESMVRQGVTTMIPGEGGSAAPIGGKQGRQDPRWNWTDFKGYFARLMRQGISTQHRHLRGFKPSLDVCDGSESRPADGGRIGPDPRTGEAGHGAGSTRGSEFVERPAGLVD